VRCRGDGMIAVRTAVLAIIAALTLALGETFSFIVHQVVSPALEEELGVSLSSLAYDIGDDLARGMFERYSAMEKLSEDEAVRAFTSAPDNIRRKLESFQNQDSNYSWLAIVDTEGVVKVATGGLLEGINVGRRAWFSPALRGPYVGDVHPAELLARLLPKVSDTVPYFVDVAFPLKDKNGEVIGVLCAHVNWVMAGDIVGHSLAQMPNKRDVEALIVASTGQVLFGKSVGLGKDFSSQGVELAQAKQSGFIREDGYLLGYAPSGGYQTYPGVNWTVIVRQPLKTALDSVGKLEDRIMIIGLLVGVALLMLGWLASKKIIDSLSCLAVAADDLRENRTQSITLGSHGFFKEFYSLVRAFEIMAHRVRDREAELAKTNAQLEGAVAERTSELNRINQSLIDREKALLEINRRLRENETALRQAQGRLIDAVESIGEGFAFFDAEDRMVLCNSRYRLLFDVTSHVVREGRKFSEIANAALASGSIDIGEESAENWLVRRMEYRLHPIDSFEMKTADGRNLRISEHRTAEGGTVSLIRDVTREREKEEELRKAREAADNANAAKSIFLSNMSHELRTPLNAILGFAQLLEYGHVEPLSANQKEYLSHILSSGYHLLELISEVLDLAKIEAGHTEIDLSPCAASWALAEVKASLLPLATNSGISLFVSQSEDLPLVLADRRRLLQILLNLGSNAIKYNRQGGTVEIGAKLLSDHMLRFTVADTGMGIHPTKLGELFQPFSRLGAERGAIDGTGIGLALSRKLAELMAGEIGFDTEYGVGSTFWLDMPISHGELLADPPISSDTANGFEEIDAPLTVLYAEDNLSNMELMRRIISTSPNIRLITALDGEEALVAALHYLPDVIILDINLPGMDGYEVAEKLRSQEQTAKIPLIAVSAAATAHDVEQGLAFGFLRYITKPINIGELMQALNAARRVNGREPADCG
jgi:signal transduction histidine kinase/CheY-like chemotaxis protein